MKSKNINLFFIITLFVGVLAISGCAKESKAPTSIVGTWTYKMNVRQFTNLDNRTRYDTAYYLQPKVILFLEDGRYKLFSNGYNNSGTYSVEGGNILLKNTSNVLIDTYVINSLTEQQLNLQPIPFCQTTLGLMDISFDCLTR